MASDSETKPLDTPVVPVQQEIPATVSPEEIIALRAAQAELVQLKARANDDVKKAKEAKALAAKAAEEQGELAKALEHYKAQAAEAEALRVVKAEYDELTSALLADLDKEVDGLPEQVKALYAAQPSLAAKKALLSAVKSVQPVAATTPSVTLAKTPFPVAGQPAAGAHSDFATAIGDPTLWAEAKARDPKGAQEFLRVRLRGTTTRALS